ncbi:MAG TPA: DoxX family protein [Ensifer sp.]|nr:DoxX family protein [Ensifer sp.]
MNNYISLAARILLSAIFIISGFGKITGYAGTVAYMEAMHVPGFLLPLVILTEFGGGLAILLGFQTKIVAFLLAGFCIVSGILFHLMSITHDPAQAMADMNQQINFLKNLSMAGGFLALMVAGPGRISIDGRKTA